MSAENPNANYKIRIAVIALNFALLGVMVGLDFCYLFLGGTVLKGVTSFLFVAIGVINMLYAMKMRVGGKFKFIMPIALAVAMAGDIAININFIAGAAVFALGHVVYVAAYYVKNGFRLFDLLCALCIFVPSVLVITLVPAFDFGGVVLEVVCVVYALILSAMTGKAVSDFIKNKSVFSVIVAVGSILFFISDLALLINQFAALNGAGHLSMRALCLLTYYPAQFFLAFSIFVLAIRKRTEIAEDKPEEVKN